MRRPERLVAWMLAALVVSAGALVAGWWSMKVATSQGECWFDGHCARGMDCVWWWGPELGRNGGSTTGMSRTCEQLCSWGGNDCPPGTRCLLVLDGPGSTCQKVGGVPSN